MDERFKKVEDEYFRLKGQLAAGRITHEQFEAALKQLMLQDAQGRSWMIGPDSGKWYLHDGNNWIESDPAVAPVHPTESAKMPPPLAPPQPQAKTSNALSMKMIGLGVAVLLLLLIGGLVFAQALAL